MADGSVSRVRSAPIGLRHISDGDVAVALGGSGSIRKAARSLRCSAGGLEKRCRREGLIALYTACAERGKEKRGKTRRAPPPPPRWAIILRQPGYAPVPIFHPRASTREEAIAVARNHIPESIPDGQLSAVEEIEK